MIQSGSRQKPGGNSMGWDLQHRRAAGYIVDLLRVRPTYAIMALFAEFHTLSVAELWQLLTEANERNEPLIGRRKLSRSTIKARVQTLHSEGLLTRTDRDGGPGAHARYELTELGAGLVASVAAVETFALANWAAMVRATRIRHGLRMAGPIAPPPDPPDAYTRRVAAGMAIGTLNRRWAFACLIWLVHGPVTAEAMREQIDASLSAIPEFEGRLLYEPTQREMLRRLIPMGLVETFDRPRPGRRPEVVYQHTALGADMVAALWECTAWSIAHDAEIWPIVQKRQNWGDE